MPDHAQTFKEHLLRATLLFKTGQNNIGRDIEAALSAFDSMLFECARARRIVRDAPLDIQRLGIDTDEFLGVMDDVAATRNVMEHWADVKNPREKKSHLHESKDGLKISVDEVSFIILGPEEIYKGQLNLSDVNKYIVSKLAQLRFS
jgi:hypothetical protein